MSDALQARKLAETMVRIGNDSGVRTKALITAMDVPLGLMVGNALEVQESVDVLAGGGPPDIIELTLTLAREMLELVGLTDIDPAETLRDGSAMDVWNRMIGAQGGDPAAPLPAAKHSQQILASKTGVLTSLDALKVGIAAWRLGAGRARKEDPVSAGAGIQIHAKPGDQVAAGAPLLTLYTDDEDRFAGALSALVGATDIGPIGSPITKLPLIIERIG